MEMDNGLICYFGPYFIEKSHGTYGIWTYFDFNHLSDTPTSRVTLGKNEQRPTLSVFSKKK